MRVPLMQGSPPHIFGLETIHFQVWVIYRLIQEYNRGPRGFQPVVSEDDEARLPRLNGGAGLRRYLPFFSLEKETDVYYNSVGE